MSEPRVEIIGGRPFEPREWLRREVLWASLMSPFDEQYAGWFNGNELAHHNGNVSRRALYNAQVNDPEARALGFFNHGKTLGGLISASAVFRSYMVGPLDSGETISPRSLAVQRRSVDIALGLTSYCTISVNGGERGVFREATRMAKLVEDDTPGSYGFKHRLLRAGKVLSGLAQQETSDWLASSIQNEAASLPPFVIHDGGTPRSAGPRVERLQPIFHEILASEAYLKLA